MNDDVCQKMPGTRHRVTQTENFFRVSLSNNEKVCSSLSNKNIFSFSRHSNILPSENAQG